MARLREEEEARSYERMIHPPKHSRTFSERFSTQPQLFSQTALQKTEEEDEVTFADVQKQMAVIINVLLSIICCSVAIWMAASHWSTPKRLGLSMSGSSLVGVAEVVIYAGYLRRIREAKAKEKNIPEVKEITDTWVIEKNKEVNDTLMQKIDEKAGSDDGIRRRALIQND